MPREPRYLISTADELTWKIDRPVIFLGEWCRIYCRRHVWQGMDAIVAAPYGLGQLKKNEDQAEARSLEEKLFPVLCKALNLYHGTQHGARFWRIVLGHWLRRYVDVMFNRIKTLEQCLQMHQISGMTAYSNDSYSLAVQDSNSIIWAFNDDRWNNVLTTRILDLLEASSFPIENIAGGELSGFCKNTLPTATTLKTKILQCGYRLAGKLASYFAKDSDIFIINSYLPKKEAIKLQLALGQFPQLWTTPKYEISKTADRGLRAQMARQYWVEAENKLENIIGVMVFELLPICYLEGFSDLSRCTKQQSWPQRPKFIFTSNNFDTDEIFKLWTAFKVEMGSRYVVGQHGNYGVYEIQKLY